MNRKNKGGGGSTKPAAAARASSRLNPAATSLLVVDAQQGFTALCPNELPVPGGVAIVPAVNALLALPFARVDATQDWHPPDHRSFHGQRDGFYPPHCVAGTPGAEFLPGLHTHRFHAVWRKGYHQDFEAYAVTAQHPAFAAFLRASGITAVVVCGIATNICCFYAARDLRREGFEVWLAEDAAAGIDVPAAGLFQAAARREGEGLGIRYVTVASVREAMTNSQ
ncbi:MAG: isochorismatase family protein [Gemmataceae bacterium]|nr:isochorismatase family protein [Gemmataceae bacterium]